MPETPTRVAAALTLDAITHANALVYTCPAARTATVYVNVANVDGAVSVDIDLAIDVGGAGTTIRYLAKAMPVSAKGAVVAPSLVLLAGDKLRARASANGDAELVASIIEVV